MEIYNVGERHFPKYVRHYIHGMSDLFERFAGGLLLKEG